MLPVYNKARALSTVNPLSNQPCCFHPGDSPDGQLRQKVVMSLLTSDDLVACTATRAGKPLAQVHPHEIARFEVNFLTYPRPKLGDGIL